MARICMLLTATPWWDRRQFHRQAPALASDGHEVIYIAQDPGKELSTTFRIKPLLELQQKWARYTGAINLFWKITKLKPDCVQLCSVEQLPLGLFLKTFTKIKVIYDCREDMYNSMLHSKTRFPAWFRRILAGCTFVMEGLVAHTFDGLIGADPFIVKMHSGMPYSRKIVFFNTALLSHFPKNYRPLRDRPFDIALLGGMTRRSGIFVLFDTLHILFKRGRKVSALLIGELDKCDRAAIEAIINESELKDYVKIMGKIDHLQVPSMLSQAKIGLVMLLDYPKFHHNIACKAFEYMACGMPVISSDLPPERFFLKESETALFIKPGDADGLAKAIISLLDDIPKATAMGEAGRKDVERQWNAERDQKELCRFYREILKSKRRSWLK